MSTEAISIVSVGVAVIGTLVVFFRWMRQDMRDMESRLNTQTEALEARLTERMEALEARLNARIDSLTARIDSVNSRIDSLFTRTGSAA